MVITFDPGLRHRRAKELEDAIMGAGAHVLPFVGGPGAESWDEESWSADLDCLRSPAQAIKFFFDTAIVGMGMSVTSFVVLALDADDADWREVLEATQMALDGRPDWRLHAAADAGRLSEVRQAIADGWPIEEFEADIGYTPLHLACVKEHLDVVKLLIDGGADVNRRCEERIGDTPQTTSGHGQFWQPRFGCGHGRDAPGGGHVLTRRRPRLDRLRC